MCTSINFHFTKLLRIKRVVFENNTWFEIHAEDDRQQTLQLNLFLSPESPDIEWIFEDVHGDKWPLDLNAAIKEQPDS